MKKSIKSLLFTIIALLFLVGCANTANQADSGLNSPESVGMSEGEDNPEGDDMIVNEIDITSVDDLLPEPDTLILHRDGKIIELSTENEYYDEIISAAKARIPEEGLAEPASALLGSEFDEILKIGNWLEFQYNEARKGKMLFMRKSYKDAGYAPYYNYSSIIFPLDNEHTIVFYTLPNQRSFGALSSPDELLQILNKVE